MLGFWRCHDDYQKCVRTKLSEIAKTNPDGILEYEEEITKLYFFSLDPLLKVIGGLYSATGTPAKNQPEIFRSLVLMIMLRFSLDNWIQKLKANPVLRAVCGFFDHLPGIASYYDFINRVIILDERPKMKLKKIRPKKKYKKGKKMPPKPRHEKIVAKLVKRILDGRRFDNRPERVLQEIFAEVCVNKSVEMGLVPKTVSISGDGTCVETGASPYGVKTCECKKQGIYNCDCPRKFSDPYATWGWDSHNLRYFYGYMGYFISTYNKSLKLDLPLYLRFVEASRHDSVSAVVALAEFRDLYPNLNINTFISDSASDNYATYELLDNWNINAVIALNKTNSGNAKYPEYLDIDDNGVPVCPGGYLMEYWGFCKNRSRFKWRCPKACGYDCDELCINCSPSSYGRVIYTKPAWDLRLFTKIPRGSAQWKNMMKQRTAAERVNNRILNHYGIEYSKTRSKKRISFFSTLAAINVHLDAWFSHLDFNNFDFRALFGLNSA